METLNQDFRDSLRWPVAFFLFVYSVSVVLCMFAITYKVLTDPFPGAVHADTLMIAALVAIAGVAFGAPFMLKPLFPTIFRL